VKVEQVSKRTRLVLVSPEGRINMGFTLRLAKNFDIKEICLVNPQFSLDDPEIKEFAAKGADFLSKVRVEENLSNCLEGSRLTICTTSKFSSDDVLRQGIHPHMLKFIIPPSGDVSLVFGRESVGLTRDELKQCDVISTLDTGSKYNVLNLSHAISIYLYELSLMKEKVEGEFCDLFTTNGVRKLFNALYNLSKNKRGVIALKHMFFRSNPRRPECGAIYRLLKEFVKALEKHGELEEG
jgi:TrmH family RNA methyltransferase